MKIFKAAQIRELDSLQTAFEGISSYELMERAAGNMFRAIMEKHKEHIRSKSLTIFA
jgi:NAD(P)H-hydrate repair Nnr-like enzyme with NAD(P)H-hydrate epimerase domain